MAAATTIIAGSAAALSAGTGLAGAISQGKQAKNYQKQIENYERQKLVNPYADLQVSTLGADRQREDLERTITTYGNLAAMSGTRGIASLLPNLTQTQNDQTAKIAANLDEQQKQIDQLKAQGEMQIQGMTEQRENNDLLGLGQAYQTATAQQQQSINQIAQGVGTLGYAAANGMFNGTTGNSGTTGSNGSSLNGLNKIQIPNLSIPQSKMIINPNGNSLIMDYLTGMVSPQVNPFMQYRPKGY